MNVRDWRGVPAARMAPLYQRAAARWQDTLAWDMTTAWSTVETARTTWGLPGLVSVTGADAIQGWTFYLTGERRLDIGGVHADAPEATTALVAALVARAGSPEKLGGLFYAAAPALLDTLVAHAVPFVRYAYNQRPLHSHASSTATPSALARAQLSAWSEADVPETVTLLHRAYQGQASPFGQDATVEQWATYLRDLVRHDGCGRFAASLSHALRIDGRLTAVSLVSSVAAQTAHVVQLVVDPSRQRLGLGRALLARTADAAAGAGFTSVSLLVAEDNAPARELYASSGFAERGVFVRLGVNPSG